MRRKRGRERKEGKIQLLKGFHTHADSKPVRLLARVLLCPFKRRKLKLCKTNWTLPESQEIEVGTQTPNLVQIPGHRPLCPSPWLLPPGHASSGIRTQTKILPSISAKHEKQLSRCSLGICQENLLSTSPTA